MIKRRQLLQAGAVIGGGFATQALAKLAQSQAGPESPPMHLEPSRPNRLLNRTQQQTLAAMTEVIIPRTDTPGAIDAGVPQFVESMVEHWLLKSERKVFLQGLVDIEAQAKQQFRQSFAKLPAPQQTELMEQLEDKAADSPWYDFANVERDYIEDAPFICQLKELSIFGFYSSEVGSTQVLRHDPMPMQFDGELPLSSEDSSWSIIRTM